MTRPRLLDLFCGAGGAWHPPKSVEEIVSRHVAEINHYERDHSGHVHQCGCAICLARCEGAVWERQRLTAVISPERFRALAEWLDTSPRFADMRRTAEQRDLERFADLLDGES